MINSFIVIQSKKNNWAEPHDLINSEIEKLSLNEENIIGIIFEDGHLDEYSGIVQAWRIFYKEGE